MNHCVLFGYPGSGKGTFSRTLTSYGYHAIGLGNILRIKTQQETPLGKKIRHHVNTGLLLEDDLICHIAITELSQYLNNNPSSGKPFVLEGFPNTLPQFHVFQEFLGNFGIKSKIQYFFLHLSETFAIQRIKNRLICSRCPEIYNEIGKTPKLTGFCDFCHGTLIRRPEDHESCARDRIKRFNDKTTPLIEFLYQSNQISILDASQNLNISIKPEEIIVC